MTIALPKMKIYKFDVDGGSPGYGVAVVIAPDGHKARAAARQYAKAYSGSPGATYTIGELQSSRFFYTAIIDGQGAEVVYFYNGEV